MRVTSDHFHCMSIEDATFKDGSKFLNKITIGKIYLYLAVFSRKEPSYSLIIAFIDIQKLDPVLFFYLFGQRSFNNNSLTTTATCILMEEANLQAYFLECTNLVLMEMNEAAAKDTLCNVRYSFPTAPETLDEYRYHLIRKSILYGVGIKPSALTLWNSLKFGGHLLKTFLFPEHILSEDFCPIFVSVLNLNLFYICLNVDAFIVK